MHPHYDNHLATRLEQWQQALQRSSHAGAVLFAGAEQSWFRDDQGYPFKANPYFAGLVPLLEHPNCCIVIDAAGAKPQLLYWQTDDFWYKPPADPAGYWLEHFDVVTVSNQTEIDQALPSKRHHWIAVDSSATPALGFAVANPEAVLTEIDYHRAVKTDYEVECMREASRIGVHGHRAARAAFLSGASEFDIQQIYCQASGQTQAELPYSSIVALAPHGAILHYQHQARSVDDAPALLIDAGGQHLGYCSDITRTWTTSDDFQALIDAMDILQQDICAEARAGIEFTDLNALAHRHLAQLMFDSDILKASPEDALASHVTSAFLPHGLGHLLGLQVHDAGGHIADIRGTQLPPPRAHPWLRLTRCLEAGMVVTIEPGIYFIDSLLEPLRNGRVAKLINWQRVNQLMPLGGIRVEDNICITEQGHENLTRKAFAAISEG
jgi:Xaa-Pro dipeptidase